MKFVCLTIFLTTSAISSAQLIPRQVDPRSPVLGQATNRTQQQTQIAPKELRCRGGAGLSISQLGATSSNEGAVLLMSLTFTPGSTTAANALEPATCSFVGRLVGPGEPHVVMFTGNRVMWIAGTLWEVPSIGSQWRPTFAEIGQYLRDPNHYWSFMATPGGGVWNAVEQRAWTRSLTQQASGLNTRATAPIAVAVGTDRSIIVIGGKHPSNKARAIEPAKISPSMTPMTTMPLLTATPNPVEIPHGQTEATTSIAWDSGTFGYCEIYWSADNGDDTELARGDKGTNLLITKLGSTYDIKMIVYVGANGDPQEVARVTVTTRGSLVTSGSEVVGQVDRRPNAELPYVFFRGVRVEPGDTSVSFLITTAAPSQFYLEVSTARPAGIGSRILANEHLPAAFPSGTQLTAFTLPGASPTSTHHDVTLAGFQPDNTYYYVITAKAPDGTYWRYSGTFQTVSPGRILAGDYVHPANGGRGGAAFTARCPLGQLLAGLNLRGGDDVDSVQPLCAMATAVSTVGPLQPFPSKFGGEGGHDNPLICPADNPIVIGMSISAFGIDTWVVRRLALYCGVADKNQRLAAHLDPRVRFNGAFVQLQYLTLDDDQHCTEGTVGVGVHGRAGQFVDAIGLICGDVNGGRIKTMGKRRPHK